MTASHLRPPQRAEPDQRSNGPVLAVFLDGLGADAIDRMPFLAGLASVRRLRTELGYSITCHASMYTGLRPDRHGLWFVWQRDERRSPFRWLRPLKSLDVVDNLALHVVATKVTRRFVRTTSWFGIPYPVHIPWRYLPQLDVAERRLWSEPGYLETSPTMFDRMRQVQVPFDIVGMAPRGELTGLAAVEAWQPLGASPALTYLFAGEIDHASHAFGQRSPEVTALLGRVDRLIEHHFGALRSRSPNAELVVWSDHGHHDVEGLDPLRLLRDRGIRIDRYLHVIDTNFIRLWIDSEHERRVMTERLNQLGIGRVLTEDELRYNRVLMPDDRYGNLIFYLELPHAFTRTIWGFGRRLASAHGYLPDHSASDGVFASSRAGARESMHVVDIAPTVLEMLGVAPGLDLDGRSAWAVSPSASRPDR